METVIAISLFLLNSYLAGTWIQIRDERTTIHAIYGADRGMYYHFSIIFAYICAINAFEVFKYLVS